jgi:hypothetical protein
MDVRFPPEDLDPHEYGGIVLNMPEQDIPHAIAVEIGRLGRMELWEYQHFAHHDHPFHGPHDAIEGEPKMAEEWAAILNGRFPEFRFVVEVSPMDRITWYQATDRAPTEDDAEFEDYSPLARFELPEFKDMLRRARDSGDVVGQFFDLSQEMFRTKTPRSGGRGTCEPCVSHAGFSEPEMAKQHRGMRLANCLACGKHIVHSTRTIRYRVGFCTACARGHIPIG